MGITGLRFLSTTAFKGCWVSFQEGTGGWLAFFLSLFLFSQYPTFCEGALVGRKGKPVLLFSHPSFA